MQTEDRAIANHTARTRTTICVATRRDMYGDVGLDVAIRLAMNNDNMKDKIDNAADKAKNGVDNAADKAKKMSENAGNKIQQGAEKVADKTSDAADKIKQGGKDLGKKVGG